ncbi:Hypothetical predicted protein, partial [Marmota monax]
MEEPSIPHLHLALTGVCSSVLSLQFPSCVSDCDEPHHLGPTSLSASHLCE